MEDGAAAVAETFGTILVTAAGTPFWSKGIAKPSITFLAVDPIVFRTRGAG